MSPESFAEHDAPHVLTVRDGFGPGEVEYTLAHHPGCQATYTACFDADDSLYSSTTYEHCGIGFLIAQEGLLDALGIISWLPRKVTHLAVGEYDVEFWSHTSPSTPEGPSEYDCGLNITPRTSSGSSDA